MSNKKHDIITVLGKVRAETAAAYFFHQEDDDKAVWIPKSQCEWDSDNNEMQMPEWLALDKGFL